MRIAVILLALVLRAAAVAAQTSIEIQVRAGDRPVAGATAIVNGVDHITDAAGGLTVAVTPGPVDIVITKDGDMPVSTTFVVVVGEVKKEVLVELQPALEEQVTVSATRTGGRLEDQPMRVEVLGREEIEEKLLMTPGDIVMMLNEMGGMRVQATSPSLGAASVRVQGMNGRYTRFLSDGLPLFGEQVGALGLLQIPPMDLGQVEVIKGVASSLYGAGAMGGVVNLVSRRPGKVAEREAMINRSTRGATDAIVWYSAPLSTEWGLTLLGGGHWQEQNDVNSDTWADLPGYSRGVFRPRLFWDSGNGRSVFATVGVTAEDRTGGTIEGMTLPQTGEPYVESLETRRVDAGFSGQSTIGGNYVVTARGAFVQQRHRHQFGENLERDRHDTVFGEVALRGTTTRHTWVAGAAIERDAYHPTDVPQFSYAFATPGVFGEDNLQVTKWLAVSASGRIDWHSMYGTFASPRISALVRGGRWNSRASFGTGFFPSSPLTEETEAAGLTRLAIPAEIVAERGRSASWDVSRTDGPVSYTVTLFRSRIEHPLHVDRSEGLVLTNLAVPTTNTGVELLGTWRRAPFALTATYTYVKSREVENDVAVDTPLTPRHAAGIVGMWERADVGRVGVEWYYTGVQRLEENPYRTASEPYFVMGVLGERQLGRLRLFINGENLTNVRQTKSDPLLRPTRAGDGRWTVDAWAPLEGWNVNGGVRVQF